MISILLGLVTVSCKSFVKKERPPITSKDLMNGLWARIGRSSQLAKMDKKSDKAPFTGKNLMNGLWARIGRMSDSTQLEANSNDHFMNSFEEDFVK